MLFGGLIGVASGVRHAIEPDHLATVDAFAAQEPGTKSAVRLAAAWGAGHATTLFLVGGALLLSRREMPSATLEALELVVAVTLVALGAHALIRLRHRREASRSHSHARVDLRRPMLVGLVHGLAGSGPLTVITLASVGAGALGLLYMALYGTGAMLGMAALAGLCGGPLARLARSPRAQVALMAVAGGASLVIGLWWGVQALARLV
ncbi:MAG: hypothetical protein IPG50_22785 [Myxococcales bacterium]|nr:hypothetical protein [Myxococcales bacterium]